MRAGAPSFGIVARRQQKSFRSTVSAAAQQPADGKGKRNQYLLAHGHELENLYPSLKSDGSALAFFAERKIPWWKSSRSGDRLAKAAYAGPSRNLASSQVSCVNFFLPLASIPGALLALLQEIDTDVVAVETIVDVQGHSAPVEFEWVGWREPLEGGPITRGANQTSIDALLVARTTTGRRAYLIEWKYCEEYLHPENKGDGPSGDTRKARYRHLYAAPTSSFNAELPFEELLYDPFYQLMRIFLVGDRMLVEGVTETLRVDDLRVLVVCPNANEDYRRVVSTTPLGRRWPNGSTVQEAMRAGLKQPHRLEVVAQEDLVARLRGGPLSGELKAWLDYHALRYGW
jgi:hypothetical protein